jgi:hypothetical protein
MNHALRKLASAAQAGKRCQLRLDFPWAVVEEMLRPATAPQQAVLTIGCTLSSAGHAGFFVSDGHRGGWACGKVRPALNAISTAPRADAEVRGL